MDKLSGQVMTFDAIDTGVSDLGVREKILSNFMAPKLLTLKKGAQVMLIKNIDSQLVNGSLGKVQAFMDEGTFHAYKDDEETFMHANDDGEDDADGSKADAKRKIAEARLKNTEGKGGPYWPMVRFSLPDGTYRGVLCLPEEWKTENQAGEVTAKRMQVPLILAWALSIHKAQGQTLNRVKVDLGKVFERGQAYVALSRATSQAGLQVMNFDQRKVMVHPKVIQFYGKLASATSLGSKKGAQKFAQYALKEEDDHDELQYMFG
jgi:ATP-dependent DNA helicase PIF1